MPSPHAPSLRVPWVRRASLLLPLALALAGCKGPYDDEPAANGLDGVLYFRALGQVAVGAGTTARVASLRTWPAGTPIEEGPERVERWDFFGTTLTVEGLGGVEAGPDPHAWSYSVDADLSFRVRCLEAGRHAVRVRVEKQGTRYEDRMEVECVEPTRLELLQVQPNGDVPYATPAAPYLVGGGFRVRPRLFAGETALLGDDAVPSESTGRLRSAADPMWPGITLFEVLTPGRGARVAFRGAALDLDLEAVEVADWELVVGPWVRLATGTATIEAFARTPAGERLEGLYTCQWTFTYASGPPEEWRAGCLAWPGGYVPPTRVCVTVMGKSQCRDE